MEATPYGFSLKILKLQGRCAIISKVLNVVAASSLSKTDTSDSWLS
jgi:hypothetical protein